MPSLTLTEAQHRALVSLMGVQPIAGRPIPPPDVLFLVERLIPCDAMGVVLSTCDGTTIEDIALPRTYVEQMDGGDECDGPAYLGVMHWGRNLTAAAECRALELAQDGISVGFRSGPDAVSQIWFDRKRHDFTDDDLARVALVSPILQRLLREAPTPHLPSSLTVQERRVLMLLAHGQSNPEIAAQMFVSVATVRKHLEHAYSKLGVHNRMAAVMAFRGGATVDPDRAGRIRAYA